MSDTPRTDVLEFNYGPRGGWGRPFDFARQFERELNAANARIAELEQELAVSKSQFEAMALAFTEKCKQ
jgi:hypothetical protein